MVYTEKKHWCTLHFWVVYNTVDHLNLLQKCCNNILCVGTDMNSQPLNEQKKMENIISNEFE